MCSNISAMPEGLDDADIYFNPLDVLDIERFTQTTIFEQLFLFQIERSQVKLYVNRYDITCIFLYLLRIRWSNNIERNYFSLFILIFDNLMANKLDHFTYNPFKPLPPAQLLWFCDAVLLNVINIFFGMAFKGSKQS